MRWCNPGDLHIKLSFVLRESALENAGCDRARDFAAVSRSALDHYCHDILWMVKWSETRKPGQVFFRPPFVPLPGPSFTSTHSVFQCCPAPGSPFLVTTFPQPSPHYFIILGW